MRAHALISAAGAAVLSACAQSPSSIAPVAIASSEYAPYSCDDLRREHAVVSRMLTTAEKSQNSAQAMDAVGVFFVLVPPSAFVGDSSGDIALFKGEKIAIERAMQHRCITNGPSVASVIPR